MANVRSDRNEWLTPKRSGSTDPEFHPFHQNSNWSFADAYAEWLFAGRIHDWLLIEVITASSTCTLPGIIVSQGVLRNILDCGSLVDSLFLFRPDTRQVRRLYRGTLE